MNPLLLKIGLPAIIFAAIAFMKWTNAKATGSPVFPSLQNDSPREGKGGSGGNPGESVVAPDSGLKEVGSTTAGDGPTTSDIGTEYATTDTSISSLQGPRQQSANPGQLTPVGAGTITYSRTGVTFAGDPAPPRSVAAPTNVPAPIVSGRGSTMTL